MFLYLDYVEIFHNNTFSNNGRNISSPGANIYMQEITGLEPINQHAFSCYTINFLITRII